MYIHANPHALSFDFTLRDPYLMFSHDAFMRVKTAQPNELPRIYADPAFRRQFRENLANPQPGILFYGDWSKVEVDEKPVTELARAAGRDPTLVYGRTKGLIDLFDQHLAECLGPFETQAALFELLGKSAQSARTGVRHRPDDTVSRWT